MRFSPEVIKVFGTDSTFYFSIVRHPVVMFESLFNYMKSVAPQFTKAGTLGTLHVLIIDSGEHLFALHEKLY